MTNIFCYWQIYIHVPTLLFSSSWREHCPPSPVRSHQSEEKTKTIRFSFWKEMCLNINLLFLQGCRVWGHPEQVGALQPLKSENLKSRSDFQCKMRGVENLVGPRVNILERSMMVRGNPFNKGASLFLPVVKYMLLQWSGCLKTLCHLIWTSCSS